MENTRLKKARLMAYLSQAELAKKLKISQSTYQRWESGAIKLTEKNIEKLAKLLDVTENFILGNAEPFDYFGIHEDIPDERTYFGEISIHFSNDAPSLLIPVSEAERSRVYSQIQDEKNLLIIESLDNRTLFINVDNIADICFSSEANERYGLEKDYPDQFIGIEPDADFWSAVELIYDNDGSMELEKRNFSKEIIDKATESVMFPKKLEQKIWDNPDLTAKEKTDKIEIIKHKIQLITKRVYNIEWKVKGNNIRFFDLRECEEETDLSYFYTNLEIQSEYPEKYIYLVGSYYDQSIFINAKELEYICLPSHKVRNSTIRTTEREFDTQGISSPFKLKNL